MRGFKVVYQKELKRVFKEPKMIFSLFILPVVLMVGIYGLMGFLTDNMMSDIETHVSVVNIQNMPQELEAGMASFVQNASVNYLDAGTDLTGIKTDIANGSSDLLVVFPENFMSSVEDYEGTAIPDIQTYYNPSEDYSSKAKSEFDTVMQGDVMSMLLTERIGDLSKLQVFTIDASNTESAIINEQKASGKMLAMILPYLITMMLFAGTMSLGTDAITGEKERGTMASMLLTPVKRSEIVLGKMFALTILSILSAAIYIIVMVIAMPSALGAGDMQISFSAQQVMMIAVIMIVLAFFYVAIIGLVSVFAKTVKEAQTYVTPLYILVIVAGMFTMLATSSTHQAYEYLIPVYGSALSLGEIFTDELTMAHFGMNTGVTLVLSFLISGVIIKAFNSEKTMFNA